MKNSRSEYDLKGFEIHRQPDDVTCGPTCLHAVYRHFGDNLDLSDLILDTPMLASGGTLGVLLATHALTRGYRAKILTWNLRIFDPSWFDRGPDFIRERLELRAAAKAGSRLEANCRAYVEFLDAGGIVEMRDLDVMLFRETLERGLPILTGLSASFLYRETREIGISTPDDVAGDPVGHFVVLTGYDSKRREILITDPMHPNPLATEHTYSVKEERVIGAIYLGVLTHDGNMVVIEPMETP